MQRCPVLPRGRFIERGVVQWHVYATAQIRLAAIRLSEHARHPFEMPRLTRVTGAHERQFAFPKIQKPRAAIAHERQRLKWFECRAGKGQIVWVTGAIEQCPTRIDDRNRSLVDILTVGARAIRAPSGLHQGHPIHALPLRIRRKVSLVERM